MKRFSVILISLFSMNLGYTQINDTINKVVNLKLETIVCHDRPIENKTDKKEFLVRFKNDTQLKNYKNFDTLYIHLTGKKIYTSRIVTRYTEAFKPHKIHDTTIQYQLKFNNFWLPKLTYKRYYDFDAMEIDSTTSFWKEKRSFLEKKEQQIITISNFFKNRKSDNITYLRRAFYEILRNRKNVFIVDEAENQKGKITIRYLDLRAFIWDFENSFF